MNHWQVSRNVLMAIFLLLFSLFYIEVLAAPSSLKMKDLKNGEYFISNFGEKVKLRNGRGTFFDKKDNTKGIIKFDKAAFGELNDGVPVAVISLISFAGESSHYFTDIAVVINKNGSPYYVGNITDIEEESGQNASISSMSIKSREIIITMLTLGPDDPMCCPSVKKILKYELSGDRFVRRKNGNNIDKTAVSAMKTDESAKNTGNRSVVVDKVSTYYPLNVGDTWLYEGPFNKAGNPIGTERVEVISYSDKYNAYLIESIEKIADISPITDQRIIEVRGNSVLELAAGGGLLGAEIKRHEMPKIVLQSPLKIGKKWVKYSQATEKETCEVVGALPSYTVKAGSFENVWKISCRIYLQSEKTGKMEFWNGTYDYYAPEVGLIKREIIKTGSTFSELLEYKIK